jgi:hypothetical protein
MDADAAPQSDRYAREEPVRYSIELAEEICHLMANGKGLRQVGALPGMPSRTSVLRGIEDNHDFRASYARAREHLMDWYARQRISEKLLGDLAFWEEHSKKVLATL